MKIVIFIVIVLHSSVVV